jgi:hypothetical protein
MSRAYILIVPTLAAVALASAGFAQAQDRYGPSAGDAASAPVAGAPARPHFLSWPGKAAAPAPQPSAPVQAPPAAAPAAMGQPAYRTLATYRAAPVSPNQGAGPNAYGGWRPVYPAQAQAQPQAPILAGRPQVQSQPAPTSIYAPAPPRPAAVQSAPLQTAQTAPPRAPANPGQGDDHVRFYSLHRQYGLQPDPAPIPPQFFSNTADLSEPPGPIPAQRLVSGAASGAPTRVVQTTGGSDSASAQQ